MNSDKRKAPRKPLRYAAWIALDNRQPANCLLSDISDLGARLDVEDSTLIPDRFVLLLARHNAPKRYCTVIWRENNQIGVRFERRHDRVAAPPTRTVQAVDPPSPPLAPDRMETEDHVVAIDTP